MTLTNDNLMFEKLTAMEARQSATDKTLEQISEVLRHMVSKPTEPQITGDIGNAIAFAKTQIEMNDSFMRKAEAVGKQNYDRWKQEMGIKQEILDFKDEGIIPENSETGQAMGLVKALMEGVQKGQTAGPPILAEPPKRKEAKEKVI